MQSFKPAAAAFEKAVEIEPGLYQAHYNLGVISLLLGNAGAGEQALRDHQRHAPDGSPMRGKAAKMLKQLEAAAKK